MRSLSLSIMLAIYAVAGAAVAHDLSKAECAIVASDAKGVALDRDSQQVTFKMQIEQLASLLPACREKRPTVCIYKDEQDDQRAIQTITWIYSPLANHMKPDAIANRVRMTCELEAAKHAADEELMESLRQSHGVPNKD